MPSTGPTTNLVIRRWRERRREILQSILPPELLAEYRRLGRLIKDLQAEEIKIAQEQRDRQRARKEQPERKTVREAVKEEMTEKIREQIPELIPTGVSGFFPATQRVPLSIQRQKLVTFLTEHGPASRGEITAKTGIPPGSLSTLLSEVEFEQVERGVWKVRGIDSKPGTSAPPAK